MKLCKDCEWFYEPNAIVGPFCCRPLSDEIEPVYGAHVKTAKLNPWDERANGECGKDGQCFQQKTTPSPSPATSDK